MGFLDNVKGKLRRGDDEWDERYDDYDDYDDYDGDDYDDDYEQPVRNERSARRSYGDGFSGSSRRDSRVSEPTPLVTNSDVRSQSYDRAPAQQNSIGVPDYTSGLQNYEIRTRGGAPVSSATVYSSTEHSDDAIAAARAELEQLKQKNQLSFGSDSESAPAIVPQPPKAPSASPYASTEPEPVSPISPIALSRNMVTLTPTGYSDAKKIADALRAGSSVVVSLASVRPEIAKRILDFSFGAASVVEGSASQIGRNVFYISRTGAPITEAELASLRGAGII